MWALIRFFLFIALCMGGWQWYQLEQELPSLKAKDVGLYNRMVLYAHSMDLRKAYELYNKLRTTTADEFVQQRYRDMRDNWENDRKFQIERFPRLLETRERQQETRLRRHQIRIDELEGKTRLPHRMAVWQKMTSWQRSLILREKCVKYMEREHAESAAGKDPFQLPRVYGLGLGPGGWVSAPDLCAKWAPVSHDPKVVEQSMNRLEQNMDYFYFSAMLREIGLTPEEIYAFDHRLSRISGDIPGH